MKKPRSSRTSKTKPSQAPPSSKKSSKSFSWDGARVAETSAVQYGKASARAIPAGEFKARCLELMDQVRDRHESIIVTKHGVPVAKLVPFEEETPDIFGFMQGTVLEYSDLISPIDAEWDALSDE